MRYIRDGAIAGVHVHIKQRKLNDEAKPTAVALFDSTAEGNAVGGGTKYLPPRASTRECGPFSAPSKNTGRAHRATPLPS